MLPQRLNFPFYRGKKGRCTPQSEQGGNGALSHQCSEDLHYPDNFLSLQPFQPPLANPCLSCVYLSGLEKEWALLHCKILGGWREALNKKWGSSWPLHPKIFSMKLWLRQRFHQGRPAQQGFVIFTEFPTLGPSSHTTLPSEAGSKPKCFSKVFWGCIWGTRSV